MNISITIQGVQDLWVKFEKTLEHNGYPSLIHLLTVIIPNGNQAMHTGNGLLCMPPVCPKDTVLSEAGITHYTLQAMPATRSPENSRLTAKADSKICCLPSMKHYGSVCVPMDTHIKPLLILSLLNWYGNMLVGTGSIFPVEYNYR